MQILSQLYVLHYNKKYKRSGTIWEGRYKSSLIEKESYLNKVISYIDYISVQNRVENSICSSTKQSKNMDKDEIEFIQNALNSETITGSKEFIQTVKNIYGRTKRGNVSKHRSRVNQQVVLFLTAISRMMIGGGIGIIQFTTQFTKR